MNPEYLEKIADDEVVFRNYEGERYSYPLRSKPVPAPEKAEHPVIGRRCGCGS
jgi:lysine 2,3-aminomutase